MPFSIYDLTIRIFPLIKRRKEAGVSGVDNAPPAPGSFGGVRQGRVLVVDDEPNIVRLVQVQLTRAGFEVEGAGDGADALIKAQANPPDILVTDVMMPNMNGFALISALLADPRFADMKIIVMTWKPNDKPREQLEKSFAEMVANSNVDCFIGKPFIPATLIQLVTDLSQNKPVDKVLFR